MTALERLGAHVAAGSGVSDVTRELFGLHLIDTVGAWIAGSGTAEGASLLRFRAAHGTDDTVARDLATRCALARLSEIDDIHLASMTTPGAIVIPGALTLAAALSAAGDDVIAAVLAGYEVMTRLGRAIDGPSILYRGIWPTYFAAPVGIAAVAAHLMKLDARQAANALALALTFAAPGVGHHNAATTSRWIAVGNAARAGLFAARAARQGFTSDLTLLDGTFLSGIFGVTPDAAALTDGLEERVALGEVSFKPWCAARQTMAATQGLREIIADGVAPRSIDAIEVFVLPPHRRMIDHGVTAGDRASHLTSVQYRMAVAALTPEAAYDVQAAPPVLAPGVDSFMDRIRVTPDDSLLADYPRVWPARVRVTAASMQHDRLVTHVPGDPARPLDAAGVSEKARRFIAPVLGDAAGRRSFARLRYGVRERTIRIAVGRDRSGLLAVTALRSHLGRNASV